MFLAVIFFPSPIKLKNIQINLKKTYFSYWATHWDVCRSNHAAAQHTDRLDTHFLLAVLCLDKKDFERAEIGFQTCRKLRDATPTGGPSEPSRGTYVALHNLGLLREMLDMPDEALEYYQLALGANPFYGPAREGVDRIAPQSASASGQS